MSGLEVTGLVLAAVPLCMKAASKCSEVRQFGKRVVEWEVPARQSATQLNIQHATLTEMTRVFLQKALLEEEVTAMLEDPLGPSWHKGDLRVRLSKAHNNFLRDFESIVELILEVTKKLLYKLGLCSSPHVRRRHCSRLGERLRLMDSESRSRVRCCEIP